MKKIYSLVSEYAKTSDMLLFLLCLISSFYGAAAIYSATLSYHTNEYLILQIGAIILGMIVFIVMSIIDLDIITDKWPLLLIFNVLFIASLFVWGVEGGSGNRNWLRFLGAGIQPSEIVKITFTILLAKQLTSLRDSKYGLNSIPSILMLVLHFGLMFGLIVIISDDLGSALIFIAIFFIMLFAAGIKLIWFLMGAAVIAGISPILWNNFLSDYQKERIIAPYFPESVDPSGLGVTWQANQSKMALASGQFSGQGFMNGTLSQSSDSIPFKHTDFIFAVIGEELGMIGCLAVLLLLISVIIRCVYVGVKSKNFPNMLICSGLAAMLTFQTFENIGMCLGITPVVGITLPFFSYGGSSILSSFMAMGFVSGIRMRSVAVRRRS